MLEYQERRRPMVAKLLPFHTVTTDVLARSVPVVRARLAAAGYPG
jgi:hypothetical protein